MKKKKTLMLRALLILGVIVFGYFILKNAAAYYTSQKLLLPMNGTYYGYYLPEYNVHPNNPQVNLITNEKPSLAMYYMDWSNNQQFDATFMDSLSAKNVIPIITWEPWNEKKSEDKIQRDYSPKIIASGKYDTFIKSWAKRAAGYNKPYFLRFAHEMNGNWYPWGNVDTNTPEDYKNMWIHVHDIFEAEGATNTIWVWSPNNTDEHGAIDSVMDYYPGYEYVDWVGYSGFNWGNSPTSKWISFNEISMDIYKILTRLNKPIMVAEISSVSTGGNKTEWYTDTITSLPSFPNIKAIVFYNENDNNKDFLLTSGMNIDTVITNNIIQNEYFIKDPIIIKESKFTNSYISRLWALLQ